MNKVAEALIDGIPTATVDPVAAALTAYEPSWRERIGNSVYDAARYLGMDSIANRLRNDVETGIDFVPFVGEAIGLDDARNDFNAGNYGMAAAGLGLSAAGIVPGVGDAVAAGGRKILSAGAENARVVADMLASGRANEVTNDMISAADPSELWKLYESGATGVPMPMDQASRMARAQEMGFDTGTPLYHGTSSDIHAFDLSKFGATDEGFAGRGIYTTDIPDLAADYGNNIIPTMRRSKSDYVVNIGTNDSGLGYIDLENRFGLGGPRDFSGEKAAELTRRAQGEGYEGFWINDRLGDETASEVITFDPTNIRSQFARFDPRLKHLSHLSAGLAGAVAAGTISLEVANQMQELGQDIQP